MKKNLLYPSIIILVALIFSWPFFRSGFIITADGPWAVVRLSEMVRELKDFQFPPRWSDYLNHGYGYPLFNFAYPLPYYLGSLFKLFPLSYITVVKTLFVLSSVLSGLAMFYFARLFAGAPAALLSALFYVIVPYRLSDLYVRGNLGESLSFILG